MSECWAIDRNIKMSLMLPYRMARRQIFTGARDTSTGAALQASRQRYQADEAAWWQTCQCQCPSLLNINQGVALQM